MPTVLELIKLSADFLDKKGIESPRLNAELLLADVMNCKRLDLYLTYDKPLKKNEVDQYREYIKQRSQFVPLQYILGKTEFYDLVFDINESVLIPRSDTEILIEMIIEKYKDKTGLRILDIGTGSGNIAVTLAVHLSESILTAVDASGEALSVAEKNAEKHNVKERIDFVKADIREETPEGNFDLIVSNPPYVSSEEYKTLQKEITGFEPEIAVTDFTDGLSFFNIIAGKAWNMLKDESELYFEIGNGQSEAVKSILEEKNFSDIEIRKDYQSIDRVIKGVKR